MQFKHLLEQFDLNSFEITAPFLEMEWIPRVEDKNAAWEFYVEMITRITTQPLLLGRGMEQTAVASIYQLFPLTRGILKTQGRYCINFTKVAVVVLNQVVRPFTSKRRTRMNAGPLDEVTADAFRAELVQLQGKLLNYTRLLADLAGVEDLTGLEG